MEEYEEDYGDEYYDFEDEEYREYRESDWTYILGGDEQNND